MIEYSAERLPTANNPIANNPLINAKLLLINGELIGFSQVEFVSGMTYRFNGLVRGLFGTEGLINNHPSQSIVQLISEANTSIIRADNTIFNKSIGYRLLTETQLEDEAFTTTTLYEGNALRSFRPTQVKAIARTNGDLRITWSGRARYNNLFFDGSYPDTEPTATYDVDFDSLLYSVNTKSIVIDQTDLTSLAIDNLTAVPFKVKKNSLKDSSELIITLPVKYREII